MMAGLLLPKPAAAETAEVPEIHWLDQSGMKIVYCVSENNSTPASALLDGDSSTIWSSDWTQPGWMGEEFPEDALTVDLGEITENVCQVKYTPRQDDINGKIKQYQILAGETREEMRAVAGGYWEFSDTDRGDGAEKYATFAPAAVRYLTIRVFDTSININGGETAHTISGAELNIGTGEQTDSARQELEALMEKARESAQQSEDAEYAAEIRSILDEIRQAEEVFEVLSKEEAESWIEKLQKILDGEMKAEAEAVYVPSEAPGTEKEKMTDKEAGTFFESAWASAEDYFEEGDCLVFDLGKSVPDLSEVLYTPRQDMENGRIIRHRIWISNEDLSQVEITGTR